jgi:hypothetical protein
MLLSEAISTRIEHCLRDEYSIEGSALENFVSILIVTMTHSCRRSLFRYKVESGVNLILAVRKKNFI